MCKFWNGLLLLATTATACSRSPVAPTAPAQEVLRKVQPQHHAIPFTMAGHPDGPILYLCATQPRPYVGADGAQRAAEDHYAQTEPCPETPVD
jgi:hypothetical protein